MIIMIMYTPKQHTRHITYQKTDTFWVRVCNMFVLHKLHHLNTNDNDNNCVFVILEYQHINIFQYHNAIKGGALELRGRKRSRKPWMRSGASGRRRMINSYEEVDLIT